MKRLAVTLAMLVPLGGCTVGPDYRQPPALTDATATLTSGAETAFDDLAPLPDHWWQLYQDPVLNGLEERALARNTDLRVAVASLEQAQATLRGIQRQRQPQASLSLNPTYGQASGDANGYTFGLKPGAVYTGLESVSYDLDLFGRLRRSIEASTADVGAAQAAIDLARVNVAASTAQAYATACAAGLEIAVTRRSMDIAQETVRVSQRRFDAGIAGINDVVRARTLLRQTEAGLPVLLARQRSALFTLATLTGERPEAFPPEVARCAMPPAIRQPIPIGDGAALLARRPDVRQAERRLAGTVARIGVSTAALYPSITLGGMLGTEATRLPDIVKDRAFTWSAGPLVSWSVPNRGLARAQIEASNAAARGALASFDGTVLTALRETDSALAALARQLDTERELAAARDDAASANRNTARLYAGGIGAFLDTLDAERTLIGAETSLAQATAQVSQDQIALFLALGGGWQDAPPVAATTLAPVAVPRR